MNLQGKRVLLTGASGGIGREIAQALEAKGAALILVARSRNKLEALKNSLECPERHQVLAIDFQHPDSEDVLKAFALEQVHRDQRIDVLINNAGNNQFSFLAQRSAKSLREEIHLNLMTPMLTSQSALSWLQRPGIILNIGSTFGSIGFPGYTSYCAAKAGVQRFSEALDRELDGAGIRVLYLAPRATNTDLNDDRVTQMNRDLGNRSDAPSVVARHVVSILEKERASMWIGWPEKLFARLNQLIPTVVSASIRKQQDTIHHYITPGAVQPLRSPHIMRDER
ncbi:SDR family oxidoreductase [Vibrio sp. Vb2880]|uniref:SDR family oxidoreductase n=1 Tax=Vibrio sp. Vb2880 TaxID=2816076 RepID=UPI001A8F62A5|nr:SDR family oxidoreductase [Vibrio sp. Vb2880]MBO0213006.1 SDR family oxidoreductase [Vibrio sp. Vb2880]